VEIRPAQPGDADVIKSFDEIAHVDAERAAFISRSIASGECSVVVADGCAVAYAVMTYASDGRGFVDMLYVQREFRRRGFGSALMSHIERLCQSPQLFTSTNRSNKAMQSLLAKRGYVSSGLIQDPKDGDPELVFMKHLVIF
jgi:ribosomal protein S18 acetylase RimI-like enzyme